MDPHYLQRIAIAGSRTSASAKPAVAAPPQMLASVWPWWRSIPADRGLPPGAADYAQLQSRSASDITPAQTFEFDPGSQHDVEGRRRSNAEPAADVEPAPPGETGIAGRSAAGVQEGPRLLPVAPEEPRETIRRVLPVGKEASITAPKGLRPAKPPPATDESVLHLRIPDEGDKLAAQAVIPGVPRPRTQSDVLAPRDLRPVLDPAAAAADGPTLSLPSDAQARRSSAESPVPAEPGTERRSAAASGDRPRPARFQSPATAEAVGSGALEPTAPAPPRRLEVAGMPALEDGPVAAPAQGAAVAPTKPRFAPKSHGLLVLPPNQAQTARSESRITIGRVEVQVNNRWPQLPAISRPEPVRGSRPAFAVLEARYLDRFSLRP
jgi:hypothetical protein